jgi:hypothetical protein
MATHHTTRILGPAFEQRACHRRRHGRITLGREQVMEDQDVDLRIVSGEGEESRKLDSDAVAMPFIVPVVHQIAADDSEDEWDEVRKEAHNETSGDADTRKDGSKQLPQYPLRAPSA